MKKHQGLSWGTLEAAAVCFYFESRAAWLRCFPLRSAGWPGPSLSPLHTAEHPELSAAAAAAHRDFNSQPGAQLTHKHTTEEESDFNRGEEFYNRWVKHFYTLCCTVKFSLGQIRCGCNEEDFHLIVKCLKLLNITSSFNLGFQFIKIFTEALWFMTHFRFHVHHFLQISTNVILV